MLRCLSGPSPVHVITTPGGRLRVSCTIVREAGLGYGHTLVAAILLVPVLQLDWKTLPVDTVAVVCCCHIFIHGGVFATGLPVVMFLSPLLSDQAYLIGASRVARSAHSTLKNSNLVMFALSTSARVICVGRRCSVSERQQLTAHKQGMGTCPQAKSEHCTETSSTNREIDGWWRWWWR